MFIYLDNLVKVEGTKEELFLIPYPRYVITNNAFNLRIHDSSKIFTDLPDDSNYIIDHLQNSLLSSNLKNKLEIVIVPNNENSKEIKSFLDKNIKLFPGTLYNEVTVKKNYQDQGYVLISDDSKIIIEAKSEQGIFYGVQTFVQLLNSS